MSDVKRLRFETTIQAPVAAVWERMLGEETYPRWTAVFAEGSYYEGSWDEGSRIRFLTPSGDGMVAEIAENRPHERISIRHLGFVAGGVEDTGSEAVRAWAPAYEIYRFTAVPEGTRVVVDQDVTADYEDLMKETWPKALEQLKRLCEGQAGG
ncbi:MAG: SRPBCC domain-containing protein [Acidobacteria bacterium]|nr:MAG: SRPBCC domain-containing protein [Acidobacteriota bacterium]